MPFFGRKKDGENNRPSAVRSFLNHLTPDKSPKVPQSPKVSGSRRSSQNSTSSREILDSPSVPNGDIHGGADAFPKGLGLAVPPAAGAKGGARPKVLLLKPDSFQDPASDLSADSRLRPQTPLQTSSRLSKTFAEVLHDKDALPYFLQYMEHHRAGHIIRFWLDAESFQASAITRIRSQSLQSFPRAAEPPQSLGTGVEPQPSLGGGATAQTGSARTPRDAGTHAHGARGATPPTAGAPGAGLHGGTPSSESNPASHPSSCPQEEFGDFTDPAISLGQSQASCSAHSSVNTTLGANTSQNVQEGGADVSSATSSDSQSVNSVNTNHSKSGSVQGSPIRSDSSNPQGATPYPSKSHSLHPDDTIQDKLRKSIERDAVSIYSKYISLDATSPIGISDELRNEAISKICREDGQVDAHCFESCQEFLVGLMEKQYFPGFLQSEFHCKHQIDILTGSQVNLADVLYNESALFYFMEFMEQEDAMGLLQCFLDLDNFQQLLASKQGQYDGMQAQEDAMVIYEKYFSLQATNPLGFDDPIRFEVECNICREEGPLPECFTAPKRAVLRTLDKMYFHRYLKSEIYFKYLSDLITTIQTAQDVPQISRRQRRGSDCSSEHSIGNQSTASDGATISTKNTLLAASNNTKGLSKRIDKALNKMKDDMAIDTGMFNPDFLWKRSETGITTMGRVNEVGQFISEFDPEPDHEKRKKNFFWKNTEKEKTQEEMALQIAQMIINDVQSATTQPDSDGEDLGLAP